MKHFYGNPFDGTLRIVGSFVAFAIGSESEYDQVTIDEHVLAAGRVLPLRVDNPTVGYARGPRTTTHTAHVIGFECPSEVYNPGPRPPRRYTSELQLDVSTEITGGAGWSYSVPFAGRRHALVQINMLNAGDGFQAAFAIYGKTWLPESLNAPLGAYYSATAPHFKMTPIVGTIGVPETAGGVGITTVASGLDAVVMATTSGVHVGGTDSAEYFDELVVIVGADDPLEAVNFFVDVELVGEEGVA